jgi:uncharacterized delta-60 repeat protein
MHMNGTASRPSVIIAAIVALVGMTAHAALAGVPPNDSDFDLSFGGGLGFQRYATNLPNERRRAGRTQLLHLDGGDFMLIGESMGSNPHLLELRRIRRVSGALDPSFASGGLVQITSPFRRLAAATISPHGDIYALGDVDNANEGPLGSDFGVVRFRADGSRDFGYGVAGLARVDFGGIEPGFEIDVSAAVGVDSDGGLIVVGRSEPNSLQIRAAIAIARLAPDGVLDTGFGPSVGRRLLRIPLGARDFADASVLAIDLIGRRIFVAGIVETGVNENPTDIVALKLTQDGELDTSFCSLADATTGVCNTQSGVFGGKRTFLHAPPNAASQRDEVHAMVFQSEANTLRIGGSLAAANASADALQRSFAVISARADDGRERPRFAPRVDLLGPQANFVSVQSSIRAMAVDYAGRLMVAGDFLAIRSNGDTLESALLMRVRSSGVIDATFTDASNQEARPGHVYFRIADVGSVDFTRASGVLMDGSRIVFAGIADSVTPNASDFYLARLRGTPDPIFAHGFE